MPFVNEYISVEDSEKYGLDEINSRFRTISEQWTIDRERNTYLRIVHRGREEFMNDITWSFLWKGNLLTLKMEFIDGGGEPNQPGWSHWILKNVSRFDFSEKEILNHREEIISDLKEALTAFKGSGIHSTNTTYRVHLEIGEGNVI